MSRFFYSKRLFGEELTCLGVRCPYRYNDQAMVPRLLPRLRSAKNRLNPGLWLHTTDGDIVCRRKHMTVFLNEAEIWFLGGNEQQQCFFPLDLLALARMEG